MDRGACIGENTFIWHWVHVCCGARIGDNCTLGQSVYVGGEARLGNNVKVQNNVSIYDNIYLGDNVFCGPSMVFTNVYNPRADVCRKDEYRSTFVGAGVTFGANSTIMCGINIGEYAFVGAGAVVLSDVKPFSLVVGVPAKHIGWMSAYGERIQLPIEGQGHWTCPQTGDLYKLSGNTLSRLTD